MLRRALRTVAVIAALAAMIPASALADADPASDVLLSQDVFYPYSPTVAASLQSVLNAAVTAAHRAGFPIKVALIRTPADLGGLPGLFGKVQDYADFLHRELGSLYGEHVSILVVMPDGYGAAGMPAAVATHASTLRKPQNNQSDTLARDAITGVEALAAATGHPIHVRALPRAAVGSGGHVSTAVTAVIFGLIAVAVAVGVIRYRQRAFTRDERK